MSAPAAIQTGSRALPKKLPVAVYAHNQWWTARVKRQQGSQVQVQFDRLDDCVPTINIPTRDTTVDVNSIVQTSALTFPCPYPDCDKSHPGNHFQDKSRWQQHIRMHNKTAPRCPFCKVMDANLRRHIRRHGKEGPVRPLILASSSEIDRMKASVLRASLEAAGVDYSHTRSEDELRPLLKQHKNDYQNAVVKGLVQVLSDLNPTYATQQTMVKQFITAELNKQTTTLNSLVQGLTASMNQYNGSRYTDKQIMQRLAHQVEQEVLQVRQARELAKGDSGMLKLHAIKADTNGDGFLDGFKVDTSGDGNPDTYYRPVSKILNKSASSGGRWSRTLKRRKLNDLKDEKMDAGTLLAEKDRQIRELSRQLRALQMPLHCIDIPPVLANSPTNAHMTLEQKLQQKNLVDQTLMQMLRDNGYTDPKYWSHITKSMVDDWEKQTNRAIKPGIKVRFLDIFCKNWKEGAFVEVENSGVWQRGEVFANDKEEMTIMCKTPQGSESIFSIPRGEVRTRIRDRTYATEMQSRYEAEIARLKSKCGELTPKQERPMTSRQSTITSISSGSSSPLSLNLDIKEEQIKSEPIDVDDVFDWTSLSRLGPLPALGSNSRSTIPFVDVDCPDMGCLPAPRVSPKVGNFPMIGSLTAKSMLTNFSQGGLRTPFPAMPALSVPMIPGMVPGIGKIKMMSAPLDDSMIMDPFSG